MVSNCPFDCSYCYLQTYLNRPATTIFVNEDDIYSQVRELCARAGAPASAKNPLRVGTGELSDSLALDPITGFSVRLAHVMSEFENVRLELKTKSKNVEHLLEIPRAKRGGVVVSWSMNPPEVIDAEEHGTARFEERVAAAALMAREGFGVGFHFDPMIMIDGWREAYERAAVRLLAAVDHQAIRWISIGGLRYQPQLKAIALKRRGSASTTLFDGETVQSNDGKVRYLRASRAEMFSHLNSVLKREAPDVYTYLCMENVPVWEKALGRLPDRGF
jgi:spore photoproduct lyase